jgi:hypothetical protein
MLKKRENAIFHVENELAIDETSYTGTLEMCGK